MAPAPLAPVLQLQRAAGNRAVNALLARDPKTAKKPPPAKPKKEKPTQSYVEISGMDPIVFESVQFGGSVRTPTGTAHGGEREAQKPAISEITITTLLGDHSNELFKRSLWGEPFSAEIVFIKKDGGGPYLKIKVTGALISNYSISGHGGDDAHTKPTEMWTLNAEKIEYETGAPPAGTPPR